MSKTRKMKIKFRQKNLKKILKFLILFNALSIPLYVMIFLNIQLYPLQDLTAKAVFNILNFFGIESNLDDLFISVPTGNGYFAGIIDWDCTGWKSILVFFALVFATETKLEKKLYGLLFVPLIYFINILRVSFVFYFISIYGVKYFALVHSFLWSFGMIMIVLIFWIMWIKYFI